MSAQQDILLNEDGSMQITRGDFKVDYCDRQNGNLLLLSEKGNWRRSPMVGIGVRKMINTKLNSLGILSLKKEIQQQFINDRYKVHGIDIPNARQIKIDYD